METKTQIIEEIVKLVKRLEEIENKKVQNCNVWRGCLEADCDWKADIQYVPQTDNLTIVSGIEK